MLKLKTPAFLNRLNTKGNKRKFLGLGVIIVIALIGFLSWSFLSDKINDNKKIFAEAAGHKIYEEEIHDLLGDNENNISDHDAAEVLANKYFLETLANEEGITITDEELVDVYGKSINKQKENDKYTYQYQVNQLYFDKLQANKDGIYKGKMLIANFSRHVEFHPVLPEDRTGDPKLGNPKAIAEDKKYAEDLINRLYNDIKSGKITFDKTIKIEHNDPLLGTKAYKTLPHSGSFDTTYATNPVINVESIRQKINEIKPGEITEPFVVRVGNSLGGDTTAESYFLVVQMDKSSGGGGIGMEPGQYIEEAKKRLGYEIYI